MDQNSLVAQRFVYKGVVKEDGIFKIVNNKKLMEHVKRPQIQCDNQWGEKGGSNRTR